MKKQVKYRFSPTLLDAFSNYLKSSDTYNAYWGFSDNPSKTEEEYEKEQFNSLIDRINRVPIAWEDSEAMDRGTAFNEVVDCMILGKKSELIEVEKVVEHRIEGKSEDFDKIYREYTTGLNVTYNNRTFEFPIDLCRTFADYFKEAVPQVHTEGYLETQYGTIYLHGYIDELLPFKVADIKTTSRYNAFKYRDYWQRIVYPFLLNQNGNHINDFEFVITDFKNIWIENYTYNEAEDLPKLVEICESFIEFIEANKGLITDEKIFKT